MFRFIFDASLRLLKKCRNISVGISPIFSRNTGTDTVSRDKPDESIRKILIP
jgi:hypothetical protein